MRSEAVPHNFPYCAPQHGFKAPSPSCGLLSFPALPWFGSPLQSVKTLHLLQRTLIPCLQKQKRDVTQKETQVAGMKTKRTQRPREIFQGSKLGFLLLLRLKIYGKYVYQRVLRRQIPNIVISFTQM